MIDCSRRIVFFGGAGVSTESGIPDFRSADGLYASGGPIPPEVILSRTYFREQTDEFFAFYRENVVHPEARPNAAHLKLAELERSGRLKAVITQNIDGLHQAAGSVNVIELHGSVHRNRCAMCCKNYSLAWVYKAEGIPACPCGNIIKPDVVLYEEPLDSAVVASAAKAIAGADMLIIGGTSLEVYPAAGLVEYFRGRHLAIINKVEPEGVEVLKKGKRGKRTLIIARPIGEVLAEIEATPMRPAGGVNGAGRGGQPA
jgi:NAD-dependent deacetylase